MSIARLPGWAGLLAATLAIAVVPDHARAQSAAGGASKAERAAARDAYDKGTRAFERGDYVAALDHFVKANALIPSVQAMYWIARSQDKAGKVEAAIEAYDAVLARADFAKLSEDKRNTTRERLSELKAQQVPAPVPPPPVVLPSEPAPPEPPPVAEPAPPPPAPAPAPVVETPAEPLPLPLPHRDDGDLLPKRNLGELGVMGGVLFIAKSNNLAAAGKAPSRYDKPVWQVGARAAFFPDKFLGIEVDYAHGFGKVKDDAGGANFDLLRGHLIGQLPSSRAVPFVLLGAGMLRAKSDASGADTDFMFDAGLGLKVMATKLLVPRLDARLGISQKRGGGFADGVVFHPEVLLGMSFVLGR